MRGAIVTGGTGFIGSAVVKELVNNGIPVLIINREAQKGQFTDTKAVKHICLDLDNINNLPDNIGCEYDVFYHFAWTGSSGALRSDWDIQLKNVEWTLNCIKAASSAGCSRFVYAGSIMERELLSLSAEKEMKPDKNHIYSAAKASANLMGRCAATGLGIDFIWGGITNAYGPGEKNPRFINTLLRRIINGEPMQFTSGEQLYDFLYIDDVARAFAAIGEYGKPFSEYVLGSTKAKPLKNFLEEILENHALNMGFEFGKVPFSGKSLTQKEYDSSNLFKDTGFVVKVSFAEGIQKTMEWLKLNDIGE